MEGDEAVQKLIFLNQRAKSKLAAGLVASGPAGKSSHSRISSKYILVHKSKFVQVMYTSGMYITAKNQWHVFML